MFRSKGPAPSVSLQDLALKAVMLLVLTRPCRGADLAALDLKHRSYVPKGVTVVFKPTHLSKQSRPAYHSVEFFFPTFKEDNRLCPVDTLKAYEQRTERFRKVDMAKTKVFLSLIGKHNPVISSTIARWLKSCLQSAGVDTTIFKAHSTRTASATIKLLWQA